MKRLIVRIDEEKCDGCGICIPACTEGALQIVDGKARLVAESLCDGLGACLGHCPRGAITVEEPPTLEERALPALGNWPVQIRLVPPGASFLKDAAGEVRTWAPGAGSCLQCARISRGDCAP